MLDNYKKKEIGVYKNDRLFLNTGRYIDNNSLYLGLITSRGEYFSDITINISDKKLSDDIAYLTNDMSNELKKFLRKKGLISETIFVRNYNLGKYEMVYINLNKIKEYDPKGYVELYKNENKDFEIY